MASKKCPVCNREIYEKCEVCPYCGAWVEEAAKTNISRSVPEFSGTSVAFESLETPDTLKMSDTFFTSGIPEASGIAEKDFEDLFCIKLGKARLSLSSIEFVSIAALVCSIVLILAEVAYYRVNFSISTSDINQVLPKSYIYSVKAFWPPLSTITTLLCIASIIVQLLDHSFRFVKIVLCAVYTAAIIIGIVGIQSVKEISSDSKHCAIFVRRWSAYVILAAAILAFILTLTRCLSQSRKRKVQQN